MCIDCEAYGPDETCPACNGPGRPLGVLGDLAHFQCRQCGTGWSVENVVDDDDEDVDDWYADTDDYDPDDDEEWDDDYRDWEDEDDDLLTRYRRAERMVTGC